jgi:hypothetical protein
MKPILCSTLLAAAAALAGCDQSDHNLSATGPYDPQANASANAAEVKLPPAITAQKAYRCKDNSLIYIDWYSDGSARVKNARTEVGTAVPAPPEGNVAEAAPSPLKGSATAASITYDGKSCHV